MFRDQAGNKLDRGSRVAFSLGLGNTALGVIREVSSGLGLDGTADRQPLVFVEVMLLLPADPAGVVGGLIKLPDASAPPSVVE